MCKMHTVYNKNVLQNIAKEKWNLIHFECTTTLYTFQVVLYSKCTKVHFLKDTCLFAVSNTD